MFARLFPPLKSATQRFTLADEGPVLCRFLDAGGINSLRRLGRPASKKRQGAKSRGAGPRLGVERYGDFRLAAYSMEARHRGDATRMPVRGGGREGGRSVPRGVERYKRAPAAWIALNWAERCRRRRGASAMERESAGGRRKSGS